MTLTPGRTAPLGSVTVPSIPLENCAHEVWQLATMLNNNQHSTPDDGNGHFTDVSATSGIGKVTGCYAFTALVSDFDNDRYPDLCIVATPDRVFSITT